MFPAFQSAEFEDLLVVATRPDVQEWQRGIGGVRRPFACEPLQDSVFAISGGGRLLKRLRLRTLQRYQERRVRAGKDYVSVAAKGGLEYSRGHPLLDDRVRPGVEPQDGRSYRIAPLVEEPEVVARALGHGTHHLADRSYYLLEVLLRLVGAGRVDFRAA